MKCDKCSHYNSEYSIICEKCGTPLKIEENFSLQEKYKKKGKHIDIEDIEKAHKAPDFNQIKKSVSKVVLFFVIIIILTLFYYLYCFFVDNNSKKLIDQYNDLMKNSSLAVFYFGNDKNINEKCKIYSNNYDFDYLNITTSDISLRKKNKIRNDLNIYNLTSTFVIVSNGVPIAITNIKDDNALLKFLQMNSLVPAILGETAEVIDTFKNLISSEDDILIYLPTGYSDDLESNDEVLSNISKQYDINYEKVDAYLLSRKQLLKIMSQLGYSEIQEDLIIYVNGGNIVSIIEDTVSDEDGYFKLLTDYDIIDISNKNYLINISVKKFETIIGEKEKSVVLIGTNNCNYCERVKPILGQIAYQYGISIYYLNPQDELNKISNLVKDIGYIDGITSTPLMLVIENKRIIDNVIGLSDKKLYIEKLTEVGIIK